MVVLTLEMGVERGMGILGETVILGGGEWALGGGEEGELGVDGDLVGGDCGVEGCAEGDLGVGFFAYFAKQGECWERVDRKLVLQGNPDFVERGIWGGEDLCLFRQARRVLGESGGGIGITGEPARCSVSVFFS